MALADPAVEAGFRMKLERSLQRGGGGPLLFQPPTPLLRECFDDPHVNGLHHALVECDYMVRRIFIFCSAITPTAILILLRCIPVADEKVWRPQF